MRKKAMSLQVAMIIAALSFTLAFAQEESPESAPAQAAAEEVSGESADAGEAAEAEASEDVAEAEEEEADDSEAVAAPSFMTPEPTAPPEGAEFAEPEAPEPLPEGKPEKVKKAKKVKEPKAPKAPREPRDGEMFGIGVRGGFGLGGFQGIEPVYVDYTTGALKSPYVTIKPLVSLSLGGTFSYFLTDLVTLSAEAQYSLYTARGHGRYFTSNTKPYAQRHDAYVYLHTLELPLIARFNLEQASDVFDLGFGTMYADAGLVLGGHVETTTEIREGYALPRRMTPPDINRFEFGFVAGVGVNVNDVLVGLRGSISVLEYAEAIGGRPWSVQLTVAKDLVTF